jgi:esterase/lipase
MTRTFFLVALLFLTLTSCKTTLTGKSFFGRPELKTRLIESPNYKTTNLSYQTNFVKVADTINIETWTISTQNPENCFFFFVPNVTTVGQCGDFMERLAIKTNSKVIGIQYRGYNYSNGTPELKDCFQDNEMIYAHFKKEGTHYKTINLIGVSLGTVLAPKLLSNHNNEIDNIILMSTFSSLETFIKNYKKNMVPFYARPFVKIKLDKTLNELNNVESLKNYKNGLLVVQAKDDKTTSYNFATELLQNTTMSRKELMTLEDGGHFALFSAKYIDQVIEKISSFIKK